MALTQSKRKLDGNDPFASIYNECYEHKKEIWPEGYPLEMSLMLKTDILPKIGSLNINEVEPMQILAVIRYFENRSTMERANKAIQGDFQVHNCHRLCKIQPIPRSC